MPQLDLGIYFIEFFFNFIFFWSLYIFNSKYIFPIINKSIKLREFKLKKFEILSYKKNYNFLINFCINKKSIYNIFFLTFFNFFIIKIKFFNMIVLKFYFLQFNKIFSKLFFINFVNKNFYLNILLK